MGRDLVIYPEKATKQQLKDIIESLGFTRCNHLWDWPPGTLNYSWFESKDFLSVDGVSADIFPLLSNQERQITTNGWAVHVRNTYSASQYDVVMLNTVLKRIRQEFGGTIKGDYGTNRYAPLYKDTSTPLSRGLTSVFGQVDGRIRKLIFAMPDSQMKYSENIDEEDKLLKFMKQQDPIRIIYNALVPFVISGFEFFFVQTFQILLKYDVNAVERMTSHNQKISFEEAIAISNGTTTLESIVASNYSFQNLVQINKAFKEWFGIDINKILFKKRKVGNRIAFLQSRMEEIIQFRHGIVHRFDIDVSLEKTDILEWIRTLQLVIEEVIDFLEKKYSIKVER